MEALTKIPIITAVHEVKRLRNFYDGVESQVRGLESLEISQEMNGCFLTPIIIPEIEERSALNPSVASLQAPATSTFVNGRVQNMDPWSMDPLRGPGPWTGSMDPLIMDRVHGPPIFTS